MFEVQINSRWTGIKITSSENISLLTGLNLTMPVQLFNCNLCYGRSDNMTECAIGSARTGTTSNQDTITFGTNITGTANPIVFNFSQWDVRDAYIDH